MHVSWLFRDIYYYHLLYLQLNNFARGSVWYETWSLTLSEEHRPREFENRVLRRIFGPKRNEVTGGWRNLNNEELHN
jgi:hypothetical protein